MRYCPISEHRCDGDCMWYDDDAEKCAVLEVGQNMEYLSNTADMGLTQGISDLEDAIENIGFLLADRL